MHTPYYLLKQIFKAVRFVERSSAKTNMGLLDILTVHHSGVLPMDPKA